MQARVLIDELGKVGVNCKLSRQVLFACESGGMTMLGIWILEGRLTVISFAKASADMNRLALLAGRSATLPSCCYCFVKSCAASDIQFSSAAGRKAGQATGA